MAEDLVISGFTKEEKYVDLSRQIQSLLEGETDLIANLANLCAAIKFGMGFFWVGFYIVKNNELVLGPFQGPIACTRIQLGKGVCGKSWEAKQSIIVEDVDQFPGHIACSSLSKSEIVIPVFDANGEVCMILDIDDDKLATFDETDEKYIKLILSYLKV